jgi:hypothetical protein
MVDSIAVWIEKLKIQGSSFRAPTFFIDIIGLFDYGISL